MPTVPRTLLALLLQAASSGLSLLVGQGNAPSPGPSQTPAVILAEVRQATGGDAWNHFAELRAEGTFTVASRTGTIHIADDLRTGANADRIDLPGGVRAENHLDGPGQDWQQDESGDIRLSPGGEDPVEIDDLFIHRHGWDEPRFGGATVTLLPPQTAEGVTYDLLACRVPGGAGFTLWIDRPLHHIDRIVGTGSPADTGSTTLFSDFRTTDEGLTLPFRKQKGTGPNATVFVTTRLSALERLDPADFAPPFRTDYTLPASRQVTVPAKGGLIFGMKVNGQGPFPTVFDTGGVNILSVNFAKRLGLHITTPPVAFGAIGGALTVHTAHVDRLDIGDLVVRNQTFYVLDIPSSSGEPEMIVGWEMMRRFAVRFDFEGNQLTLTDAPTFGYSGTGTAIPLISRPNANGVEIHAAADGHPGSFLLDTGNEIGLFLNAGFVDENALIKSLGAHLRGYNGKGFGGPSPEAWFTRLHTLQIGDITVADPVVRLQTRADGPGKNAGNIGQSILRRFTVTVDTMHGLLYLEKNATWNRRESFNRAGLILDPAEGIDNVMTVLPGSPAAAAGFEAGDRITRIDGKTPADDPNDPAFEQPVGTVVHLTVQRGTPGTATIVSSRTLTVTLADVL